MPPEELIDKYNIEFGGFLSSIIKGNEETYFKGFKTKHISFIRIIKKTNNSNKLFMTDKGYWDVFLIIMKNLLFIQIFMIYLKNN